MGWFLYLWHEGKYYIYYSPVTTVLMFWIFLHLKYQGIKIKMMLHFKDYGGASWGANRLHKICWHKNIHIAKIISLTFEDIFKPLGTHFLSLRFMGKKIQFVMNPFLLPLLFLPKLNYEVLKKKHLKKVNEVPRLLFPLHLRCVHWSRKGPVSLLSSRFQGVSCLWFRHVVCDYMFYILSSSLFCPLDKRRLMCLCEAPKHSWKHFNSFRLFIYSLCPSHNMFSLWLCFELLELWYC